MATTNSISGSTAVNATSAIGTSSIDVNSIVSQLMTVEQQPITKLNTKEASYQAKLSAYGSVKGAVSSFQTALQGLNSVSKFNTLKVTSADTSVASASASSIAVAGTYSLEVTSLAQSQRLLAAGQSSSTAAIGAATSTTVSFDFGTISGGTLSPVTSQYTGATFTSSAAGIKTVTIDSSNNSLQGIRDAINAAKIGVTASIVNDGNASTPYRLVLSSDSNGASGSMKITTSGDASIGSLLAHDPAATQNMAESVTATNALFKVNGVSVSKPSNTVSDVIQGVMLTLNKVTSSPINITVARDTAGMKDSINAFAKAYNDLSTTLKSVSAYDPVAKKGAALQGDSAVRTLQAQLRNLLSTSITGTTGGLNTLTDVGVSFQKDGSLAVNASKLDSVMASNYSDIAGLFAAAGKTSDSLVTFNNATSATKPGSYALNITQVATQGNLIGSTAANTSITSGVNDVVHFTVNGVAASITLSAATYTAQTLIAELQSKLNSVSALSTAGISVAVTQSAGVLNLTSNSYGSISALTLTGGNGAADLLGIPTASNGVDVQGSIGGISASGSGQILSSFAGDTQGLSMVINGGALGARGTLNYSHGYANLLNTWSSAIVSTDGPLASATTGVNNTIKDLSKRRTDLQTRLVDIERRYRTQFTALDSMLSSMNQTSVYLTQQLARL